MFIGRRRIVLAATIDFATHVPHIMQIQPLMGSCMFPVVLYCICRCTAFSLVLHFRHRLCVIRFCEIYWAFISLLSFIYLFICILSVSYIFTGFFFGFLSLFLFLRGGGVEFWVYHCLIWNQNTITSLKFHTSKILQPYGITLQQSYSIWLIKN